MVLYQRRSLDEYFVHEVGAASDPVVSPSRFRTLSSSRQIRQIRQNTEYQWLRSLFLVCGNNSHRRRCCRKILEIQNPRAKQASKQSLHFTHYRLIRSHHAIMPSVAKKSKNFSLGRIAIGLALFGLNTHFMDGGFLATYVARDRDQQPDHAVSVSSLIDTSIGNDDDFLHGIDGMNKLTSNSNSNSNSNSDHGNKNVNVNVNVTSSTNDSDSDSPIATSQPPTHEEAGNGDLSTVTASIMRKRPPTRVIWNKSTKTTTSYYATTVPRPVLRETFSGADLRVMVYITTHMSPDHIWYLKHCWRTAMEHSLLLRNADIGIYLNSPEKQRQKDKKLLLNVFQNNNVTIFEASNKGSGIRQRLQFGAMAAMTDGSIEGWFLDYDWVIRVNADVIIRKDAFLLDVMQHDANATALLVEGPDGFKWKKRGKKNRCKHMIMTDFFGFKPGAIRQDQFTLHFPHDTQSAEVTLANQLKEPILSKKTHRWVREARSKVNCRVGTARRFSHEAMRATPLVHYHPSEVFRNLMGNVNFTFQCPIPFT